MTSFLEWLFPTGFMPHGHCYLWRPDVLWLHVISDGTIAAAYFAIPVAVGTFVRKRMSVIPYWWVPALFAAFIFLCGSTHLMSIWTVWNPDYVLDGFVKLLTAAVSAATAVMTFAVLPAALKLRGPLELQEEVHARTAELLALNDLMRNEIATRERVERELRESRAELRFVTENTAVLLAHCDRDGRYIFVNRPYAERLGKMPQEIIGKHIDEVIGRDAYAAIEPYLQRVFTGERVEFETEIPYERESRFMHCSYVPDKDAETGIVKGLVASISDITDRRRLEEQLRDADRRKDEFLAVLAHELRNPLAPMQNAVRILEIKGGADAPVQKSAQILRRQVGHMARLVDDLLEISRITGDRIRLQREPVDLSTVVTNAAEAIRPAIEVAGQRLNTSMHQTGLYVEGDVVRLTQVITNLLNNANKYTPERGRIDIALERRGAEARIRISDTGIGIADTMRERVFEMFVQLEAAHEHSRGGLGVGLTLAKRLVDLHGGRIEVESDGEGRGSTFTVCLPLMERPVGSANAGELPTAAPSAARILVVDDNADAVESLAIVLQSAGHTVQVAYDGVEAVEEFESFAPDIAILDIGMPRMNGYEAAQRIRQLGSGTERVLVALSGWGQAEDKRRAREAGFDEHLTKPVDPEVLLQVIARLRGLQRRALS